MLDVPLPAAGERVCTPFLHGSADALLLARLARRGRPLVAVTATAADAQRIREEIPFFDPGLRVFLFPDWETLPYDLLSPHHDLVSERLATLYQLMRRDFDVAIVPVTTALYRLAPVEYLAARSFSFTQGQRLEAPTLRRQLVTAGYSHVTRVTAPGEYCVRGGLIDLFPAGSALPYRLELDDEVIESMRSFDVDTQRSIYKVNEVRLLPAREFPLDEEGQARFRHNFRVAFEGDPSRSLVYKDVSKGIASAGIEYYLPLFFDKTSVLTDYFPEDALLCAQSGLQQAIEQFWSDTHARYAMLRGDRANPVLPPQDLFLTTDQFFGAIKPFARVELKTSRSDSPPARGGVPAQAGGVVGATADYVTTPAASQPPLLEKEGIAGKATTALPSLAVERRASDPVHRLRSYLASFEGRVLIVAEGAGRRETMLGYFTEHGLAPVPVESYAAAVSGSERLMITVAPLHAGFVLAEPLTALVTENELYAEQARARRARDGAARVSPEGMLRDLSEIRIGDPAVHEQHGIGRYQGLVSMNLGEGETEFLALEYARGAKLYVPVSSLHLVSRYSGAPAEAA
ncbi:MAG TPA: CarD family transcriptional regulator, partial [Burkholderiales bacterium]|nr:CarD family transcriptional regulator [Burkholderiales bacterium]